ncbi:MAG: DUF4886 domain-containing protein [Prevotella sp.]|nr:DUF4886 domain-containing protein [Prevotella sp.]
MIKSLLSLTLLIICTIIKATNPVLNKTELRVLDIGNSYTNDATALLPLITSESKSDVSNLCLYKAIRGGGSFKSWYDVYHNYDTTNTYSVSRVLGGLPSTAPVGIGDKGDGSLFRSLLTDENWDIIIIHQVSKYAPYYEQWCGNGNGGYLNELLSIIKQHQPNAVIGFYLIHSYWDNYEGNKEQSSLDRWKLISSSVRQLKEDYGIDFIIPYGTAIENIRASSFNNGYDLTRDGTHCDYGLCRYTAACCYYEVLIAPRSQISILGNPARYDASENTSTYPTVSVTDDNAIFAQKAAHCAVNDWYNCLNPELYSPHYSLTYILGGVVWKTDSLEYGATIVTPMVPAKEGHVFTGWSEILETMPAKDVTIVGDYAQTMFDMGDQIE